MVREATKRVEVSKGSIRIRMPDLRDLPYNLIPYHRYASNIYEIDGVVMLGKTILIPTSVREQLFKSINAAHQNL